MSRGLGRAVAETLVGEGARVIPVSRDEGALDEVAAALGGAAVPFAADLADATAVDALAARVNAEVGGLDGILVNAGGPPPGSTLDFSDEQREGAFRFLIGGPVRLLRALVARLNEGASILFVTSSSVRQPIHRVRFLDERRAQAASVSVDEQVERMVKTIPLGRYGDPAELGRVAAFLLSPAASLRPATWTTTEPGDPASPPWSL